jgi:hypothetical protein
MKYKSECWAEKVIQKTKRQLKGEMETNLKKVMESREGVKLVGPRKQTQAWQKENWGVSGQKARGWLPLTGGIYVFLEDPFSSSFVLDLGAKRLGAITWKTGVWDLDEPVIPLCWAQGK